MRSSLQEYFDSICATDWIQFLSNKPTSTGLGGSSSGLLDSQAPKDSVRGFESSGHYISNITESQNKVLAEKSRKNDQLIATVGKDHLINPHDQLQEEKGANQDDLILSASTLLILSSHFTLFQLENISASLQNNSELVFGFPHEMNVLLQINRNLTRYRIYQDHALFYSDLHCMALKLIPSTSDKSAMRKLQNLLENWIPVSPTTDQGIIESSRLHYNPIPNNPSMIQKTQIDQATWTRLIQHISAFHKNVANMASYGSSTQEKAISDLMTCFQTLVNKKEKVPIGTIESPMFSKSESEGSNPPTILLQANPTVKKQPNRARSHFDSMAQVFEESSSVYCSDRGVLDVEELKRMEKKVIDAHLADINTLFL